MYAIVAQSGKQTVVREGDVLSIDRVEIAAGQTLIFEKVMGYHDGSSMHVGQPYIKDIQVSAEIIEHKRDRKIRIVHFKRRKNHLKWQGHRQAYTNVRITEITAQKKKKATKPKASSAQTKKTAAEKKVAPKAKAATKSAAKKESES